MKILAVDDDEVVRELLSAVLTTIGFTHVKFAVSGADALRIVDQEDTVFDCFLLDIQMPSMTGISLLSKLRSHEAYARTPILMITAMSDRTYIDSAFAAGATDYINKPFNISELQARLKLIEQLVMKRVEQQSRNPVEVSDKPNALMAAANTQERLHIEDVDRVIDYLSLENYILQMSRVSLFGNCVFGVVIKDGDRIFNRSSDYEYRYIITDIAEAISECAKPYNFFVAHAGCGDFACISDIGRMFDSRQFALEIDAKIREMDLFFCDGRPMLINVAVGQPIQLDMKSPQSSVKALLQALRCAEDAARTPNTSLVSKSPGWKKMLSFG
jgi:CheY-like chemotaxis protein